MRNNEFNNVEITNEKQVSGLEFGKTQKSETISQNENKLPEGELNEKYVGKTIRKQTEVNVKYSSTGTAPAHGSTTVTSATTASNIAATTATVATAASVVAVTVVAVGTGISVALHDYDYKFNYFEVTSDSLMCEFYVVDHKNEREDGEPYEEYDRPREQDVTSEEEEKEPFTLRVYNKNYDYSIPAYLYSNYGEFSNLKPNEQYHIVLTENRFGGETIFDEMFTTKEKDPVSEFRSVIWDKKCNFLTNKTTIQLDYIDEAERFSNFKFILKSELVTETGPLTLEYDLKKTTEPQEVQLDSNPNFNLSLMYEYSFTYKDNGEEMTIETGTFQFEDNSGAKSEFNKFIFDKTANFKNRTFDVQLDYVDDFNVYSDFVLTFIYKLDEPLQSDHPEERGVDVALRKTTEVQTISLDGIEISLSESYGYRLTCKYKGELETLEEGDVTFTDNSGAVVKFNEFIFDETINYDTREISFQLDYVDELDYLYGFQFILMDLETEEQRVYYLNNTTEVQTITVDEVKEYDEEEQPIYYIDPVKHHVKYSFVYWKNNEEIYVVKDKECKFKNSLKSTFTGIDTPYDFAIEDTYNSYILPIRFIFDDAAHIYSGFEMQLYIGNELYGHIEFEGDTNHSEWMNGVFMGENEHTIEDVIYTDIKVVVKSWIPTDDNPYGEETEIYSETAYFTKDEKVEIYAINLSEGPDSPAIITYGQYEICFMPIFSGPNYMFSCALRIECQTGNIYDVPFVFGSKNQLVYANLNYCGNFFEENFEADFSNPVKISLVYVTYHYEMVPGDSTTDPHEELVEDSDGEKIKLLYESYQFMLQA